MGADPNLRGGAGLGAVLFLVLAACGGGAAEDVGLATQGVVGGRLETAYPAVGFMMVSEPLIGPYCGATLIAPRVAVTAAHCIYGSFGTMKLWDLDVTSPPRFGIGLMQVGDYRPYRARRVVVHPNAGRPVSDSFAHDIALLFLEETPPVDAYPVISDVTKAGELIYVGYGRTLAGPYDFHEGYTNERKSGAQVLHQAERLVIETRGVDAGTCKGDSGGPLLSADGGEIYGVLTSSTNNCNPGNISSFPSLFGDREFIERTIREDDGGVGLVNIRGTRAATLGVPVTTEPDEPGCGCQSGAGGAVLALLFGLRRRRTASR